MGVEKEQSSVIHFQKKFLCISGCFSLAYFICSCSVFFVWSLLLAFTVKSWENRFVTKWSPRKFLETLAAPWKKDKKMLQMCQFRKSLKKSQTAPLAYYRCRVGINYYYLVYTKTVDSVITLWLATESLDSKWYSPPIICLRNLLSLRAIKELKIIIFVLYYLTVLVYT